MRLRNALGEYFGSDMVDQAMKKKGWDSDIHVVQLETARGTIISDWHEQERMNARLEEAVIQNEGKPPGMWYHLGGDASEVPIKIGYCKFNWKSWDMNDPAWEIPYPPELWFTAEFMDKLDHQLFSVRCGSRRCPYLPGWRYPQASFQGESDKTRVQYTELVEQTDDEGNPFSTEGRTWIWSLARTVGMYEGLETSPDLTHGRLSADEGWDQLNNCIRGRWMD